MVDDAAYVTALTGASCDAQLLGGKAAALDRVVAIGLPVPPARVLNADAYRRFVASPTLSDELRRLLCAPVPPPERHDIARDGVDRIFLEAPMPPDLSDAIRGLAPTAGHHLAVRSSATVEDLATASFAGQYRSMLGVPPDGLERAVRLVWASLWHPAPRIYRAFMGLDDGNVAMAVLTMEMIEPVVAGVLFTRDPTGSADDMRLETVEGLGEALVSGAVTPRARIIARDRSVRGEVDAGDAELVEYGCSLEHDLGAPQDIEWARDPDGRTWILQSRPITTIADPSNDGFDVRRTDAAELTTAGIDELLPGVLPPLVWSTTSWHVEEGFRDLFVALGAPVDDLTDPHGLVARVRGRAAIDLDRLRAAAMSIPGGSAAELERRYFGEMLSDRREPVEARPLSPLQGLRILRQRQRATLESEIVVQAIGKLIDVQFDLRGLPDTRLVAYRRRVQDLAARTASAEIAVAALAAAAYRSAETGLIRRLGEAGGTLAAQQWTRPHSTHGLVSAVEDVIAEVLARPDLEGIHALDWIAAKRRICTVPGGPRLLERLDDALGRAGCAAVFGGLTWSEQPELAWLAIRDGVTGSPNGTAGPALETERPDRGFLRREIDDAASLLERRERTKAALLALGGVARRIDDELGRRLVERELLETIDDVRLLAGAELEPALYESIAPSPVRVSRRRRILHRSAAAEPLPRRFRGMPVDHEQIAVPGDAFRGWGASPGSHEGRVCIVDSPAEHAIRRGDVLVAMSTDASWAPLFHMAGAVVVEDGGPLSHAAIVARELGVPAVVNVPGIVARLRSTGPNTTVTVDGTRGSVHVHEPTDALPSLVPVRHPRPPMGADTLGVFVTGLIGAGALIGAFISLTEAVGGARARRRTGRRAAGPAAALASVTTHGSTPGTTSTWLRSRRWYAVTAAILAATALATLSISVAHYTHATSGARALWFAALGATTVSTVVAAIASARSAIQWPDVSPAVRRLTNSSRDGDTTRTAWNDVPRVHRLMLSATAGVFGALLILVTAAEPALRAIDQRVYDALDAGSDAPLWGPEWFDRFLGSPAVVIPVALIVTLFTLRCRVLALAYPAAIVAGGLANLGIGAAVGRHRPLTGEHPGRGDSFPSGGAIESVLLFGLMPLAVGVLLTSPTAMRLVRVAATAVLVVMLADNLRSGSHWPSDQLAGVAIAMFVVVAVHTISRLPILHDRCGDDCPALALVQTRPTPGTSS